MRPTKGRRRLILALLVLVLLVGAGAVVGLALTRDDGAATKQLRGTAPNVLARSERLGPLASTRPIAVSVVLRRRNERGFDAAARAVADRSSALFGKGLSPSQVDARFGPPHDAERAWSDYLRRAGLSVTPPAPGSDTISAAGSAGAVGKAFGVHLARWREQGADRVFYANDGSITLPSSLAASVKGIFGLNNYITFQPAGSTADSPSGLPALTPKQLKEAYDVRALTESLDCDNQPCDGSGQTVATFAIGGINKANISKFDDQYGADWPALKLNVRSFDVQHARYDGPELAVSHDPDNQLYERENELDIETVRAVAPGATIDVYELAPSDGTLNAFLNFVEAADQNGASVMSISYDFCESDAAAAGGTASGLEGAFRRLAIARRSVFVASGDYAGNCKSSSGVLKQGVFYPASNPFVTSVGGTRLEVVDETGHYKNEGAWSKSGRGQSALFARPAAWQHGEGVPEATYRLVPDVSGDADPETTLNVFTYDDGDGWVRMGGTSAAAPAWAAFAAIFDQRAKAFGEPPLGFANPSLYAVADLPGDATWAEPPLFDVTDLAGTGWDEATGLGSVNAYNLARDLVPSLSVSPTQGPSETTLNLVAAPFPIGDSVHFTWHGVGEPPNQRGAFRGAVPLCTATVDANGRAACTGTISTDAPDGAEDTIDVIDISTMTGAQARFLVQGKVSGSGGRLPPSVPGTHTITGRVEDNKFDCVLDAANDVSVADEHGTIIGVAKMGPLQGPKSDCYETFVIRNVPDATFYKFEESGIVVATYSKAQLQALNWKVPPIFQT